MNELVDTRKPKERSPNFPFISLELALKRAEEFYGKEKRGNAPFKAAAAHWGYSPTSSGAMQTAAALKSYGLLVDEGRGDKRMVRLTDTALRILLDTRPDSYEREQYKRQASLSPAIATEIHEKWPDGLPSEATLNHFLVLERGFNQVTAVKVANILQENEIFTTIGSSDTLSSTSEIDVDNMVTELKIQPSHQTQTSGPSKESAPTGTTQRIVSPDGKVIIQLTGQPSWETYNFLEQYASLLKGFFKPGLKDGKDQTIKVDSKEEEKTS